MNEHIYIFNTLPGKSILPPINGNKTWYKGYYIDVRNNKRIGINFIHQFDDNGNIINEKEIKLTEL